MRNDRAYYSAAIADFLRQSRHEILGVIAANDASAETTLQQNDAWLREIDILKDQLKELDEGRVIFEYTIPRKGKRVDVVVLYQNIVFLLEFKCGDDQYRSSTYDQVYDYALDLRNFQRESHDKLIAAIMVSTEAEPQAPRIVERERIIEPICCNSSNIAAAIAAVVAAHDEPPFNYTLWESSEYLPTPTIIEAAQALYTGHNVRDISRSDAGARNLTVTTDKINEIVESSKRDGRKAICFVTGVPGAGKTLVWLNVAIQRAGAASGERAVFLSGNYPLVCVLQEALARDKIEQVRATGGRLKKQDAIRSASSFIQIIHKYRDYFIGNDSVPPERIVIFDEAQRAWTQEHIAKFMWTKKGVRDFAYSEPEFLISTMDRHSGWAVIVCLIGGGQEINTGEAGLPEWFDAMRRSFRGWDIYTSARLGENEYRRGRSWDEIVSGLNVRETEELHLAASMRSFRTPDVSAFVNAALDVDVERARVLYASIRDKYPIVITRDLAAAKAWLRERCRGTARYGLLASSSARRLKADGIFVKNEIDPANWFLNDKDDVRSSYALEDTVTEFDIQGLELDYALVAWDVDLRFVGGGWSYYTFKGARWNGVGTEEGKLYLKNAYRVLLTRARQGMAIFVPVGSDDDITRKREFYDGLFCYLRSLGLPEL